MPVLHTGRGCRRGELYKNNKVRTTAALAELGINAVTLQQVLNPTGSRDGAKQLGDDYEPTDSYAGCNWRLRSVVHRVGPG